MEITIQKLPAYELRSQFLVLLFEISKPIYRFIFKSNTKAWTKQLKDLKNLTPNSLGNDLYIFLSNHGFNIEAKLESHDVGHVLLGYDTDVVQEVCMQFFYLGSGKKSVYSLLTVILGYLILPEYYSFFNTAFKRGKTAINFQKWDFEHLLKEPTSTLQAQIFQIKQTQHFIL